MTTLGFIGLGVMGEPMARNLTLAATGAEQTVTVHDLRPEPVARLVADGAVAAATATELAARCTQVHLSLPGGDQLAAVVGGLLDDHGAGRLDLAGRLIVDHTTAPVGLTRELASRCRAAGADYCDAPVARTRQAAVDGTLAVMVGGSIDAFDRLLPSLAPVATDVTRCGGVGAGQLTKLLNNMMLFQNVRAVAEAHAIAAGVDEQLDVEVDVETVFAVIAGASGGSFALGNHGMKAVLPDRYPLEAFSTTYARKDLSYAMELAAEVGIDAEGARTVGELMERAAAAGLTEEYFPVFRRLL
ncbi:MAG: NAD(P)-dependent oxidoreductase [Actinomycetota bacterium]